MVECFTVYANDLKGILSPLFFISEPENTKGFIALNKIAEINPSRKINNLDLNDLVPYVGLPETDDLEIKEVLKRPYKEVKGRNIIKKGDILFARIEPSIFNKKYILADNLQGNDYAFTSTEFYIVKTKENINPKFLFYMFFTKEVYAQVLGRTTGKVGIIPEDYPFEEANINEHVFLLRVKQEINPYYVFSVIKSELGQIQINREITGGTIMGIIRETTEALKIPLPPLPIQNKIAEEVKKRMQKAEQLQKSSKEELEKAKLEVKRIILGENDE